MIKIKSFSFNSFSFFNSPFLEKGLLQNRPNIKLVKVKLINFEKYKKK